VCCRWTGSTNALHLFGKLSQCRVFSCHVMINDLEGVQNTVFLMYSFEVFNNYISFTCVKYLKHLKTEFLLNDIYTFNSYLTENT
jgi:hypothetical protein